MKPKELKLVEPEPVSRGDDADELHARRVVLIWAAIAVLLLALVVLGYNLAQRDINRIPPGMEEF